MTMTNLKISSPSDDGDDNADTLSPPIHSQEWIARQFAEQHGDTLRYVAPWNAWFIFDGSTWRRDEKRQVFTMARAMCSQVASEGMGSNSVRLKAAEAKQIASAKTRAAIIDLAREDRDIAATVDQWDTDDMALNTPIGVVDLRTGEVRAHSPNDFMTKSTRIAPGGEAPLWMKFLNRVTSENGELQGFLQRVAGYCLTGCTNEHALFFLHGAGGNGKGTFIETLGKAMGDDYWTEAPIETFQASSVDRHPTELAMLAGARMVTADETEEGRSWAESRIKKLTGGATKLRARFMRQDFFEFRPRFKLVIIGNNRPNLNNVDEAMQRRMHLIPFNVIIPEGERDRDLPAKLQKELPGILAWMIEGAKLWHREGLNPPSVVRAATKQYFEAEDLFAAWLEECCDEAPDAKQPTSVLFASWETFAESRNEKVGTSKSFAKRLTTRGFEPCRERLWRGYSGLKLKLKVGDGSVM